MDMTLAGFIALGALIVGQFAWLRQDIRELRKELLDALGEFRKEVRGEIGSVRGEVGSVCGEVGSVRGALGELRERVARIEGLLEAVFMRRDLTPFPEPPPSGDRSDESRAA